MRPSTTLRVATANAASGRAEHRVRDSLWSSTQPDGGPGARHDLSGWAASVAGLDLDVLAVQEVDHRLARSGQVDQTAEIATACAQGGAPWTSRFAAAVHGTPGRERTMRPAAQTRLGEPSYGIAVLSRHPVREWRELRMSRSRVRVPVPMPRGAPDRVWWVPDEQRVALAGVIAAPGGDLTVVSTHLSFAPARAAGQLRELVAWAQALPRPLLLLGDLNLPGRLPAWITGWSPLIRAATFPAARPRVQLDHLLLDAGGEAVEVRGAGARMVASSDHRALRAEIEVRRRG